MEEVLFNKEFASLVHTGSRHSDEESVIPYKRSSLLPTGDFCTRFIREFSTGEMILPQNTRYVNSTGDGVVLVLEETPRIRTIVSEIDMTAVVEGFKTTGRLTEYGYEKWLEENVEPPYRFQLAFPYIVYVIHLSKTCEHIETYVFFRIHPITSLSDYLFKACLPNISGSQSMCLGESRTNPHNIIDGTTSVLDRFWLNSFNKDYVDNYAEYGRRSDVSDFLTWQFKTLQDPMFIYAAQWIPYKRTLGQLMEKTNDDHCHINFSKVINIFKKPKELRDDKKLFSNVVESICIESVTLAVGDEVEYNNSTHYISSFIGKKGDAPHQIELEGPDNKKKTLNLTPDIKESFAKQQERFKMERSVTINGINIKVGEILLLHYPQRLYKKITEIRKARDGRIEVRFRDSDYYLLENVEFEKFDESKVKISGNNLTPNQIFYLRDHNTVNVMFYTRKIQYRSLIEGSHGKLYANFHCLRYDKSVQFELSTLNDNSEFVREDDIKNTRTFRFLNQLIVPNQQQNYGIVNGKGIMCHGTSSHSYDMDLAKYDILAEGGSEINIPSYDIDINFKIGDHVVIADWNNPVEMVKVRIIDSFEINQDNILHINTKTHTGELRSDSYVDFQRGTVEIGKIRKIVLAYNDLHTGDKIRASIPGMVNFPKKDANMIVGFIVDTGTRLPLMLCSNCCTLWPTDDLLSRFTIYRRHTIECRKQEITSIEPRKIKFQSGDLIFRARNGLYILHYNTFNSRLDESVFSTARGGGFNHWGNYIRGDQDLRYGIITPRYSLKMQTEQLRRVRCFPNLHGGFIEHSGSRLYFKEDWDNV